MEKITPEPEKSNVVSLEEFKNKRKREALLRDDKKREELAEQLGLAKEASDEEIARTMAVRRFDLPPNTTTEELKKTGMNIFADLHAEEYEKQEKEARKTGKELDLE